MRRRRVYSLTALAQKEHTLLLSHAHSSLSLIARTGHVATPRCKGGLESVAPGWAAAAQQQSCPVKGEHNFLWSATGARSS